MPETLLNRTSDPATDLVSLTEAKAQLRVDHTDEDTYITALVSTATAAVEEMSGLALITQTWSLSQNGAVDRVYLPTTPVQSIDSITYYDRDEVQQTGTVANFHLFSDIYRAWVEPKDNQDWPDVFDRPDALTISFVAGYGAASDVPSELKQATLMLLTHWYDQRASVTEKAMQEVPYSVGSLVGLYRKGWIGA